MTKIILENDNILIKELAREKEEATNADGIFIPEQNMDDEQVAQGTIIQDAATYKAGEVVLFHKVIPVDVHMKLDGDESIQNYFFIKQSDVICRIVK